MEESSVEQAVLRVLAYFDVFAHPLRSDEILRYLPQLAKDPTRISATLQHLQAVGLIQRSGAYWALEQVEERTEQRL